MKEFSRTLDESIQEVVRIYLTTNIPYDFARKRVRYEVTSRLRPVTLQEAYDRFDQLLSEHPQHPKD